MLGRKGVHEECILVLRLIELTSLDRQRHVPIYVFLKVAQYDNHSAKSFACLIPSPLKYLPPFGDEGGK